MALKKIKDKMVDRGKFIYSKTLYSAPKKFKKALIKMYKVFPYGLCSTDDVAKLIPLFYLHRYNRDGFIEYIEKKDTKKSGYVLGIKSLPLISMWKVETLTRWVIFLTALLIILTLIMIGISLKMTGVF